MTQATTIPAEQTLFTRERVEKSLVYVSRILTDIVMMHDNVVATRRKIDRVKLGLDGWDPAQLETEYKAMMERLRELVDELDVAGVELIDFEAGIVLFPTVTQHGDGVFAWSLRAGGDPYLTKRELVGRYVASERQGILKGGTDA